MVSRRFRNGTFTIALVLTLVFSLRPAGTEAADSPFRGATITVVAGSSAGGGTDVFNAAETEYFASLYPQSASEIRSYATYRKKGEAPPAVLGTSIDRKG